MKRDITTFMVKMPKPRHHRALFDDELPFKHRVERRKDGYQRKQKHRNRELDFVD